MNRLVLAWSGGKDSLMALTALEALPEVRIEALITTVTDPQRRISMHGVRESLLDAQGEALDKQLIKCRLPPRSDNDLYRDCFATALRPLIDSGITGVAYGDIYLVDVRAFRETQMRALGCAVFFPLWHVSTLILARRFITSGYRAIVCCVDSEQLDPAFLGREYNDALLAELPPDIDPCGENGEFHTFVYAGPRFASQIAVAPGHIHVADERFHFLDLVPIDA